MERELARSEGAQSVESVFSRAQPSANCNLAVPGRAAELEAENRERLLLENLPYVRDIARRIHRRGPAHVPLEDLVHAGVVGLIDAVAKFNPAKNVELKTYAKFRIRGAILDNLRSMDWSPRHLRRQARRLDEVHQLLKVRLGRIPNELEVAAEFGLSLAAFQRLLGELRGLDLSSLQAEPSRAQSGEEGAASVEATHEDPYILCLNGEMRSLVEQALVDLDANERQVVILYYFKELTMKAAGSLMGVSESRISQIHSVAIARLRSSLSHCSRSRLKAVRTSSTPSVTSFPPRRGPRSCHSAFRVAS